MNTDSKEIALAKVLKMHRPSHSKPFVKIFWTISTNNLLDYTAKFSPQPT